MEAQTSDEAPRRPAMPPAVHRYVAAWASAGIGLLAVCVLLFAPAPTEVSLRQQLLAVVFLIGTAIAAALAVGLNSREVEHRISFIEASVVACLVVLDPAWTVVVITAGVAVSELVVRRPLVKASFNIGQYAVATGAAALTVALLRGGRDAFSVVGLLTLIPAMVAFGMTNLAAMNGLLARLQPERSRHAGTTTATGRERAARLSLLGNTAIGVLGAAIAVHQPWLLPLLLVPVATLYLANQGVARTTALLSRSESERMRLDRIIQGVSDGVAFLDADGVVQVWSPSMEELTGISAAGAVGAHIARLLDLRGLSGDPIAPRHGLTAATPDAPGIGFEARLTRPDGAVREVRIEHTVVFSEGVAEADVVLLRDVTRERELDRAKDDFLMRISHELRTPLTPIRGYAESLRLHRKKVTPELLERALLRIEDRAVHMTRLIDDLLLVANLGTSDARIRPADIRVADPVRTAVTRIVDDGDGRPVQLQLDPDAVAFADQARVEQILLALLDNALRYSEAGTPIQVRATAGDSAVVVEVVDEGRGIPPEHLGRIFERFHRVEDPLVMTTAGVGIGLYLARELAEAMGGELTCRSEVGAGSTFVLSLPKGGARIPERSPVGTR